MRNTWGKRRKPHEAYHVAGVYGVELRVLKVYSDPRKPYARALTWGRSKFCPSGEIGDTYCSEIPGLIEHWVETHKRLEEES